MLDDRGHASPDVGLEPALPLLLLLGFAGLVRSWRRSSPGHRPVLLASSLIGIFLLSSNWVACGLAFPLEAAYSRNPTPTDSGRRDRRVVRVGGSAVDRATLFVRQPRHVPPVATRALALQTLEGPAHPGLRRPRRGSPGVQFGHRCGGFSRPTAFPRSSSGRKDAPDRRTRMPCTAPKSFARTAFRAWCWSCEASGMPRAAASFEKMGIHVVPAPIRFFRLDRNIDRRSSRVESARPKRRDASRGAGPGLVSTARMDLIVSPAAAPGDADFKPQWRLASQPLRRFRESES